LEKIRAAEIDEEHRKTNETHKPGKVAWWEIDRGNV
jgi:hypothetical protein